MIPRILHFCYFGTDRPAIRFPLYYYLAVRSAAHWIKPEAIYFHNDVEPTGPYWEAVRPYLTRVAVQPPSEIYGRKLNHPAHKSDVFRLWRLIDSGGVYLDMDTICRKPWDDLFRHPAVLGLQENSDGSFGLCNAVVMSEPGNSFMTEWLQHYRRFSDDSWDEFSVRLPLKMADIDAEGRSSRSDIHVEPTTSFFTPSCIPFRIKDLFERDVEFPDSYCHHLWDSMARERYCDRMCEQTILEIDTAYNRAARPFLPEVIA